MTLEEIKKMSKEEIKYQLEWSDEYEFGTIYAKYLLKEKQELTDYLKEKENKLQKKVVYYEKQLKGTERNSFYYSSYLKNIHKLNAQRELIKEILSKIEKSDKQ